MNNTTANYNPGPNDWESVTISNFTSTYQVDNLRIKFQFTSGGGNDLFIDDINLSGPVGLSENETIFDFFVFPNPASNVANVQFYLSESQDDMNITLHNLVGKKIRDIYTKVECMLGLKELAVDVSTLSAGIYFVTISNSSRKVVQRFVVE